MKKSLLLVGLVLLSVSACGKKETTPIKATPPQAATESATSAQPQQTLTPQNAHDFASNLSAKMSAYELVLKGAFGRGNQAMVEKTLSDLNNIPTWPKGDAMDPYTKCDTAWRDLSILANAQSILLKNPSDSMRKIEAQEASDYQKSKSLCTARVNMTPEQAEKAEADEYKK